MTVPERQVWALMLGEHMMRLAETSRAMGHGNPAATVMYVEPAAVEWGPERQALAAVLDFARWCSRGKTDCAEGRRFLGFVDEITARRAS